MSFSSSIKNFTATLLRLPLKLLVREQRIPSDLQAEFNLKGSDDIIYVMRTVSISSIEILRRQAEITGLPEAKATDHHLAIPETGSCVFIQKRPKFFGRSRSIPQHKDAIAKLLKAQQDNPQKNYKLVPVSIFWGRNPGKEKSFFRYLMSNIEEAGRLRKFFIMLFLGRQCFVQFGQPIDLSSSDINYQNPFDKTAQKLSRILRIHFNRQWVATMGPRTENRRDLVAGIVASDIVQEAVKREMKKTGKSKSQSEQIGRAHV